MPNNPPDPELLRRELHHVHLPLLADTAFISWDTDPFTASRGPRFDEIAVVLEALQAKASSVPDSLVVGCQRLEDERQDGTEA